MTVSTAVPVDLLREGFKALTAKRRSIRAFLPQEIDQETLESIFVSANQAPSNANTQPWHAFIASGDLRDQISRRLIDTIGQGNNVLDFPYDYKYVEEYRRRQLDVGILLYKALGVTREDTEGKKRAWLRNLELFDAPHVAFLFMSDWGGLREAADVGMYAQNLMLSIEAHGAASCPQTILGYNSEVVREAFNIGPEYKLLFGISFGYADMLRPENRIVPDRARLEENTHFHR
ncbi:MAG: nitroreductase [Gammaproteobacteria bacterium]|jgi:nitroreductase